MKHLLWLLALAWSAPAQIIIGGGFGGPGAPNPSCTFSASATSCVINTNSLAASAITQVLTQCFTGASTTQTPVTITSFAYTTANNIVATVTPSFGAAAAAGYCVANGTGSAGSKGATGSTGLTGTTGSNGLTGPTGAVGATGSIGPTGAQGVTGSSGQAGASYAPGAFGPCGKTVLCTFVHGLGTTNIALTMTDSNGCHLSSSLNVNSLGCAAAANVISVGTHPGNTSNAVDVALDADISGNWGAFGPPGGPPTVIPPSFNQLTGTYNNVFTVTITEATPQAVVCYTTDGSAPAAASQGTCTHGTQATPPVNVSITVTGTQLQALGTLAGSLNSAVTSATYTLQVGTISAIPSSPYSGGSTNVTLTTQTTNAAIHYRTDGNAAACTDTLYTTAISVTTTTTLTAVGCLTNFVNSQGFSGTYTISNTVATPTDAPGQGTYTTSASVTLSTATAGATICYRTDGVAPTSSPAGTCAAGSTTYSAAFSITATSTLKAIGTKSGLTDSGVLTSVYTIQAATPTDSPGQGSYASSQNVTLSDTTSGVTMCYTTDGSTPTASAGSCTHGTTYSTAFPVAVTTTVKALATKSGINNSGVLSSTYTITAASFVAAVNFSASNEASFTMPNLSTNSGDTIVLAISGTNGSCSTSTFTAVGNSSDTFTQVGSVISSSFACLNVYMMASTSASSTYSIVVTGSAGTSGVAGPAIAFQFRGWSGTVDQGPNTGTAVASSPISSSGMTTTHASEVIIMFGGDYYSGGTTGAGTGYTVPTNGSLDTGQNASGKLWGAYQIVSSTNTYTPSLTSTNSNVYVNFSAWTFF